MRPERLVLALVALAALVLAGASDFLIGGFWSGGEQDDEWFLNNLLATLNVAVSLEDETWQLALRVLPEAGWDERTLRLAAAAHSPERRR